MESMASEFPEVSAGAGVLSGGVCSEGFALSVSVFSVEGVGSLIGSVVAFGLQATADPRRRISSMCFTARRSEYQKILSKGDSVFFPHNQNNLTTAQSVLVMVGQSPSFDSTILRNGRIQGW
jgi:hypothetical protein